MSRLSLILGGALLCCALTASAQQSASHASRTLSFQGAITAMNGNPLEGNRNVVIRLYTDASGEREVWRDIYDAHFAGGVFSIDLGSGKPLPTADVMGQQLWVGIQIDRDAEMRPLAPLSAAPFALSIADRSVTREKMATDYVSSISLNGQKISGRGSEINLVTGDGIDATFDAGSNTILMNANASNAALKGASAQASNNNILNQTTVQSSANFNISGSGSIGSNLTVAGNVNTTLASGVVHSGGSGTNLSSSAVALASEVSGTLPIANGGTGLTSSGSSGNFLKSSGSGWSSAAISHSDISDWSSATADYATQTFANASAATAQGNAEAYTDGQLLNYELASHVTDDARAAISAGTGIAITDGVISTTNTGSYIDNSTSLQDDANFNIGGTGKIGDLTVSGVSDFNHVNVAGLLYAGQGFTTDNGNVEINQYSSTNTNIGGNQVSVQSNTIELGNQISGSTITIGGSTSNVTMSGVLDFFGDLAVDGTIDAANGVTIASAPAADGHFLRGDGTAFKDGTIQTTDLPDLSGSYIDNSATPQVGANFNIDGDGAIGGTLTVSGPSTLQRLIVQGDVDINSDNAFSAIIGGHFVDITAPSVTMEGALLVTGNISGRSTVDASNGYTTNSLPAPDGHYLRGDGTSFTDGTIQVSDLPNLPESQITGLTSDLASKESAANVTADARAAFTAGSGISIASGVISATNSGSYINNSTSQQSGANFNIGGTGTATQFNSGSGYQIGGTTVLSVAGAFNAFVGGSAGVNNTSGQQNAAVGQAALASNTTGSSNTAVGQAAMIANTTGSNNTATGLYGLDNNSTGNANTASGAAALFSNTTGSQNTGLGSGALQSNTTGSNNTGIGWGANVTSGALTNATAIGAGAAVAVSNTIQLGNSSVTAVNTAGAFNAGTGYQIGGNTLLSNAGSSNLFVGVGAGSANAGSANTASGYHALYANTSGSGNTASGNGALSSNSSGSNNTAFGNAALARNTTGIENTAVSVAALISNTTGEDNTATGFASMYYNTSGSNNTASGVGALENNTTGGNNTAVGFQALSFNSTGSGNTAIGDGADVAAVYLTNATAIGNSAVVQASNSIQLGNSSVTTTQTYGDVYVNNSSRGIILKDANNNCWRVTVTTGGALQTTAITCPN